MDAGPKRNFSDARRFDAALERAKTQLAVGRLEEASRAARDALAMRPSSAAANGLLGLILGRQERYEDAIAHLCASLSFEPANWETLWRLNAVLTWLNRQQEMTVWLENALRDDPRLAPAHHLLGLLLRGFGRADDAAKEFEQAIALDPRNGRYHLALSGVTTYTERDPHFEAMERRLRSDKSLPDDSQVALRFALAKAYADIGRHERAFSLQLEANRIERRRLSYDEATTLGAFEHTKAVFTREFLRSRVNAGDPSDAPIFIVGMPRSGSTLIEQILASHPAIHGTGETRAFLLSCQSRIRQFPADVPALDHSDLRAIGARYLDQVQAQADRDVKRVTDKMLSNFAFLGLIHLALPNARFIHAVRDPVDTCLSCFAMHFHEPQPFAYDLGELGRYYSAYRSMMDHWTSVLPEGVVLDVPYEEVVGDVERTARRMVEHCDIAWDAACLDFVKSPRPVWTASDVQVRRPLYATSIGRPRPAADLLQPLLAGLRPMAR